MTTPNQEPRSTEEIFKEFSDEFCEYPAYGSGIPYLRNPESAGAIMDFFRCIIEQKDREIAELKHKLHMTETWVSDVQNPAIMGYQAEISSLKSIIVEKEAEIEQARLSVANSFKMAVQEQERVIAELEKKIATLTRDLGVSNLGKLACETAAGLLRKQITTLEAENAEWQEADSKAVKDCFRGLSELEAHVQVLAEALKPFDRTGWKTSETQELGGEDCVQITYPIKDFERAHEALQSPLSQSILRRKARVESFIELIKSFNIQNDKIQSALKDLEGEGR